MALPSREVRSRAVYADDPTLQAIVIWTDPSGKEHRTRPDELNI